MYIYIYISFLVFENMLRSLVVRMTSIRENEEKDIVEVDS